ncbi:MAG: DMT family transporter [Clostridia bacterium]|nr:DMT family transporter [Clostridia bacterium]
MSQTNNKAIFGRVLLLLVTIAWGSSFIVLKDTLTTLGNGNFTFFILALRFLISGLILSIICYKRLISIKKSTFFKGLFLGVILFCAYGIQTVGLRYTTPSKNAFLTAVYVVLVPFLSWLFLSTKPVLRHYVGAVICMVGIAFVAIIGKNEHASKEFLGDLLSLASGIFYAFQIIYISKHAENEDAIQLLIIEILTVSVLCVGVTGIFEFPLHYQEFSIPQGFLWKIAYLAVVCTLFAQFGQMIAQKYTPPTAVAILFSFEAVFGVLFELIFGKAEITYYLVIGFTLIFISEIISEVGIKKLLGLLKNKEKQIITDNSENNID